MKKKKFDAKELLKDIRIPAFNLLSTDIEDWERGYYSMSTGASGGGGGSHLRTKNNFDIPIKSNSKYILAATHRIVLLFYKENGEYIEFIDAIQEHGSVIVITPYQAAFVKAYILKPEEDNSFIDFKIHKFGLFETFSLLEI